MSKIKKTAEFRFWMQADMDIDDLEGMGANAEGEYFQYSDEMDGEVLGDLLLGRDDRLIDRTDFTSCYDEEGNPLYFDDVVRFEFHDDDNQIEWGGTALVSKTINGGMGLKCDDDPKDPNNGRVFAVDDGGFVEDYWEDPEMWSIKKIGNAWENPELVK